MSILRIHDKQTKNICILSAFACFERQTKQSRRRFSFHSTTGTDPSGRIAAGVRSDCNVPQLKNRTCKGEKKRTSGDRLRSGESLRMGNILENRVLKFLEPTKIISNPSNSCAYARFQYFGIGKLPVQNVTVLELSRVGLNGRSYQMQEDPMSLRSASWSDLKGLDVLFRPTCFEFNLFTLCPLAANCHSCHSRHDESQKIQKECFQEKLAEVTQKPQFCASDQISRLNYSDPIRLEEDHRGLSKPTGSLFWAERNPTKFGRVFPAFFSPNFMKAVGVF